MNDINRIIKMIDNTCIQIIKISNRTEKKPVVIILSGGFKCFENSKKIRTIES
jgi:hypothetical protein